jgi:cell division protease FtsH
MGGRAAEERLLDGDFTSGSSEDYAAARIVATNMVTRFAMGQRGVAHVGYDAGIGLPTEIEAAIDHLLEESLTASRALLHAAPALLEAIADELLEDETVGLPRLRELADAGGARSAPPRSSPQALDALACAAAVLVGQGQIQSVEE